MAYFKTATRYLLGLLFIAAGVNHFWHTRFYVAMMPAYLPAPLALVYLSGIAEAGVGALLMFKRYSVLAGWGVIVLCIAVFPANVQMAIHPELYPQFSAQNLWIRLPFQLVPMIWAYWYTRRETSLS